jgi:hypothetical protein
MMKSCWPENEPFLQGARQPLAQVELHGGVLAVDIGQHVRQEVRAECRRNSETERASRPADQRRGAVDQAAVLLDDAPGVAHQFTTERALRRAHSISLEKLGAQRFLHARDLRRQCRLTHAQLLGGTAEAAAFGHRDEVLELPQRNVGFFVHRAPNADRKT